MKLSPYIAILFLALTFLQCNNASKGQSPESIQQDQMNGKLEPEQFEAMLAKMPDAQLVDVRTPEEFAKGHLKGAKNMDYQSNEFEMDVQVLDKNKPVFV